jgi:hypothetical protein
LEALNGAERSCNAIIGHLQEVAVADSSTENELILTIALLVLLALAVVLIANLIGAIHVIG